MRKLILLFLVISLVLLGACSAPSIIPPEEESVPAISEPTPTEKPESNMKIVAAELSWAQKYMEDFVFNYPIVTDKMGIREDERRAYYKWGYTDDDFPVQILRIGGGSKYYLLCFMPASNIVEAKTHIIDGVYSADIGLMPSKLGDARDALYSQIALSHNAQAWYETHVSESDEFGLPPVHWITEFFREYREKLRAIILRLEAAEAELIPRE